MAIPIRTQSITPRVNHHRERVGDMVRDLARTHAAEMNACDFAIALRERRVLRRPYVSFLTTMYPLVVGFNRALIRSISKVDHVRHSAFVRVLADQLKEEQAHNQMWRTKLAGFEVDHEAFYGDLEDYLAQFSAAELEQMTAGVLEAVRKDSRNSSPGCFPDAILPEPMLALYHLLWQSASADDVNYWEHFACQCGIEMIIYDVVNETVLPGVVGNPELDVGPASTHWWREHGRSLTPALVGRSDEEKHLEMSLVALNRSETANTIRDAVVARASDAMRLFAASLICQSHASLAFPLEKYQK